VDIEKGAVDIARLRFWLSLVIDEEKPKPLPNLDYKIVVGDSLISRFDGEVVEIDWDVKENTQTNMFGNENLINREQLLQTLTAKQRKYFDPTNENKKDLALEIRNHKIDILINQLELMVKREGRGLEQAPSKADYASNKKFVEACELYQKTQSWLKTIDKLNYLKQHPDEPFNHFDWKLDFPEVLNPYLVPDERQRGFDIVIGNPPYVEAKKLKHISDFLQKFNVYSGTADLSSYFFEIGINICKVNAILCLINTNKFFNTGYGKPIRALILKNEIKQLLNFEQVEVFENILVSSVIIGIKKKQPNQNNVFSYKKFYKLKNKEFVQNFHNDLTNLNSYSQGNLSDSEWSFADSVNLNLKSAIENNSTKLMNIDGISIYRGVTTGYNPAFIISNEQKTELIEKDEKNKEIIKPLLQGRNIRKWIYNENGDNLIFTKQGINIETYPVIKEYLLNFYNELKPRSDNESDGRKPGSYKWFEIQDNTAYYYEFEKTEKIIWGLTADKWAYAYDDKQHYLPSNGYILTSGTIPIKYLLAILNSNVLKYYFGFIGVMTAGGAYTLKHATIQHLPIKLHLNNNIFCTLVDYIIFIKSQSLENLSNKLMSNYFEQIINGMVYELYFPELLQKYDCEIIKYLGELPEFTESMNDEEKMKICQKVYDRLNDAAHPVRIHLEKMKKEIPEIRIIEGLEN
jgi:hypothetical protein